MYFWKHINYRLESLFNFSLQTPNLFQLLQFGLINDADSFP